MDMKLEKLKQELKQKNKELDEYIETHENYLSDEAEAIRKDIYKIANEINRIEESKENNEEENKKYTIKLTDEEYRRVIENAQRDIKKQFEQKVKDIINENGFEVYTREYGNVEVVSIEVLEELLEEK